MKLATALLVALVATSTAHAECVTGFEGRVTDIYGKGVKGFTVTAFDRQIETEERFAGEELPMAETDDYGFWRITGLNPGMHYTVSGVKGYATEETEIQARECQVRSVAIQDPWIASDRAIESPVAIYGRLLDLEGRAHENTPVRAIHARSGNIITASTDRCGWFFMPELRSGDGPYEVSASKGNGSYTVAAEPEPGTALAVDLNNGEFAFNPLDYQCKRPFWGARR